MENSENCLVCKGNGEIELLSSQCPFCNGTGEFTKSAESYLQSHICQCIFLDRKMCFDKSNVVMALVVIRFSFHVHLNQIYSKNTCQTAYVSSVQFV